MHIIIYNSSNPKHSKKNIKTARLYAAKCLGDEEREECCIIGIPFNKDGADHLDEALKQRGIDLQDCDYHFTQTANQSQKGGSFYALESQFISPQPFMNDGSLAPFGAFAFAKKCEVYFGLLQTTKKNPTFLLKHHLDKHKTQYADTISVKINSSILKKAAKQSPEIPEYLGEKLPQEEIIILIQQEIKRLKATSRNLFQRAPKGKITALQDLLNRINGTSDSETFGDIIQEWKNENNKTLSANRTRPSFFSTKTTPKSEKFIAYLEEVYSNIKPDLSGVKAKPKA